VRFFHDHNARSSALIEARLSAIKAAEPLTTDPAVIVPQQLFAQALIEQPRATLAAVARFDEQIAAYPRYPTTHCFLRCPGPAQRLHRDYRWPLGKIASATTALPPCRCTAVLPPVTERSGKSCRVHWRWQCPKFLRQTFVEWTGQTIPRCFWAAAYYHQQRAKGASHQVALRALAFKWIRILYRCWQTRTPYHEARYLKALQRRGSPLLAAIPPATQTS
jgi:hypothetical protein